MSGRSLTRSSIGSRTRHRVRVQFFGDVSFNRIQPHHRRRNTRELEHVIGDADFGFAENWISKGDINSE